MVSQTSKLILIVGFFSLFVQGVLANGNSKELFNITSSKLMKTLEEMAPIEYKGNLTSISLKLEECYSLHHKSITKTLFFLEKGLNSKLDNITVNPTDIDTHIRQLENGLDFAINVKPHFFRKEALALIKEAPKEQIKKLTIFFNQMATSLSEGNRTLHKLLTDFDPECLFPSNKRMQDFLKNTGIMLVLAGALMDLCGLNEGVSMQCSLFGVLAIIGIILWYMELEKILSG